MIREHILYDFFEICGSVFWLQPISVNHLQVPGKGEHPTVFESNVPQSVDQILLVEKAALSCTLPVSWVTS